MVFNLNSLVFLILFLVHLCNSAWDHAAPVDYNDLPCLGSLSFHTEAVQLSSQLWAWQCSCRGNQNNHFILLDLAGECFHGQSKLPRHTTIIDAPMTEKYSRGLLRTERLRLHSSSGVLGAGGWPSWRPSEYKKTFACNTTLITKRPLQPVWWLRSEIQPPIQPTKQPKPKTNAKRIKIFKRTISFLRLLQTFVFTCIFF